MYGGPLSIVTLFAGARAFVLRNAIRAGLTWANPSIVGGPPPPLS